MKIIEPGHVYQLRVLDTECRFHPEYKPPGDLFQPVDHDLLVFVNREEGTEHAGYQTQDVICALIDRTAHCDACLRWEGNDQIIYHLRMALMYHEQRALMRKLEKGEYRPELVAVDGDGHWPLRESQSRQREIDVARAVREGRLNAMPASRDIDTAWRYLKCDTPIRVVEVKGLRRLQVEGAVYDAEGNIVEEGNSGREDSESEST